MDAEDAGRRDRRGPGDRWPQILRAENFRARIFRGEIFSGLLNAVPGNDGRRESRDFGDLDFPAFLTVFSRAYLEEVAGEAFSKARSRISDKRKFLEH